MALQKSSQCTRIDAGTVLPVKEFRALVRTVRFDYTQVGAGLIGDQVELCDLPAGARILGGLSYIRNSGGAPGETISLGTRAHRDETTGAGLPLVPENATRFGTGVAANNVASFKFWSAAVVGFFIPADDQDTILGQARIVLTFAGATPPDGQKLTGEIVFVEAKG